jgi:hypothetical protein
MQLIQTLAMASTMVSIARGVVGVTIVRRFSEADITILVTMSAPLP